MYIHTVYMDMEYYYILCLQKKKNSDETLYKYIHIHKYTLLRSYRTRCNGGSWNRFLWLPGNFSVFAWYQNRNAKQQRWPHTHTHRLECQLIFNALCLRPPIMSKCTHSHLPQTDGFSRRRRIVYTDETFPPSAAQTAEASLTKFSRSSVGYACGHEWAKHLLYGRAKQCRVKKGVWNSWSEEKKFWRSQPSQWRKLNSVANFLKYHLT